MRRLGIAGGLLLAIVLGCQGPGASAPGPCPVTLVDAERLPDGLRLRQRFRVLDGEREIAIDLAVQTSAGQLTIVGFTPFGTRAFAITQRGSEASIDDFAGRRMGVRPEWTLDALHRSLFIAPPTLLGAQPMLRWSWGGEAVLQTADPHGEPAIRRFRRPAAEVAGTGEEVWVDYSGGRDRSFTIANPWCGYTARIDTLTEE